MKTVGFPANAELADLDACSYHSIMPTILTYVVNIYIYSQLPRAFKKISWVIRFSMFTLDRRHYNSLNPNTSCSNKIKRHMSGCEIHVSITP